MPIISSRPQMVLISTTIPSLVWRIGVGSPQYFSRVVLIVLQGVDALSAFVLEPGVYVCSKWIHARIVRH